MKRRITAMLIVLAMLLGMMPGTASAATTISTVKLSLNIASIGLSVLNTEDTVNDAVSNNSKAETQGLTISNLNSGLFFWNELYDRLYGYESGVKVKKTRQYYAGIYVEKQPGYDWPAAVKNLPDLEDVKITKVPGFKVIFNGEQRTDVYLKYNQYWEDLTVFVPIDRMPNTMTAQGKTVKIKASKLKKKKQIIKPAKSLRICNAVGSLKFKLAGVNKKKFKKYFKVNAKNGNITIKKGLKKGKYKLKIDITAAGNANYLAGTKSITVTVRVK